MGVLLIRGKKKARKNPPGYMGCGVFVFIELLNAAKVSFYKYLRC